MIEIKLLECVGSFAENKDTARDIRVRQILPELKKGGEVVIDFFGVGATTQSFVHALISDTIRQYGAEVLDKISFRNCNDTVKKIIEIVVGYMQDSEG
jgi:STAS-like domain of unknown function (DUF4325)